MCIRLKKRFLGAWNKKRFHGSIKKWFSWRVVRACKPCFKKLRENVDVNHSETLRMLNKKLTRFLQSLSLETKGSASRVTSSITSIYKSSLTLAVNTSFKNAFFVLSTSVPVFYCCRGTVSCTEGIKIPGTSLVSLNCVRRCDVKTTPFRLVTLCWSSTFDKTKQH